MFIVKSSRFERCKMSEVGIEVINKITQLKTHNSELYPITNLTGLKLFYNSLHSVHIHAARHFIARTQIPSNYPCFERERGAQTVNSSPPIITLNIFCKLTKRYSILPAASV